MDFEFSADQEMLRDSVRRFLADRAPTTYVRSMLDDERGTTDAVWNGLAELGVTGLLAPEPYGGAGMGMVDMATVLEELGRAVHPGPFTSSAVGAVSAVALAGSAEDQERLLPDLASGARVGALAIYEAGRRAAWQAPSVEAAGSGTETTLTGEKVHVADGAGADVLVVSGRDADGALGLFEVDARALGVRRTPAPTVDGTRKEATVTFDAAPARRLAGDDTLGALAATVDRTRVAMVVDGVGAASRALDIAVEYAKTRRQFDRPIGSFQAVQHLCADMLRAVELSRAAGYYACWACDAADAGERHRATTLALAAASDGLYQVGASAIQVHGGIGFTWEHDIHLYYKRLLTLQHIAGGASDQLEELASIALEGAGAESA
ncbi:MAG TPA: acyl-CoA dehydrogenase family protein [Acidimicrobiia bacterium]